MHELVDELDTRKVRKSSICSKYWSARACGFHSCKTNLTSQISPNCRLNYSEGAPEDVAWQLAGSEPLFAHVPRVAKHSD